MITTAGGGIAPALAQSTPPPGVTIPPNAPERIEEIIPRPSDSPPLPLRPPRSSPPPSLEIPPTPPPVEPTLPTLAKFRIKQVEVVGNTVLQNEITNLIKPFKNRLVTFDDLINLLSAITQLYVDNGYVTSGAFLATNQRLNTGIVRIQVIEGTVEQIEITGLTRLREGYIRSRVARGIQTPLNRQQLERSLQLLQLDHLLAQVNAELTAGSAPGRTLITVAQKVKIAMTFSMPFPLTV